MSIWSVDLTTEDGARSATSLAGMACFIAGGLSVIGTAFAWNARGPDAGLAVLIAYGIETLLFVVAGFRFRAGKGFFWGIGALAVLALEIALKLAMVSIGGLIINGIMLFLVVNGVRAARTLRRGFSDGEALAEVFG